MKSHVKALIVWSLLSLAFYGVAGVLFVTKMIDWHSGSVDYVYLAFNEFRLLIVFALILCGFLCLIGVLVNAVQAINHSSDEIVDRQETEATVILDLQQRVKALEHGGPQTDSTPVGTSKEPEPSVIEPNPVTPEPEAPEEAPTPELAPSEPEPRPEETPEDSPVTEPAPAPVSPQRKTLHFCPRCGNKIDLAPDDDFCPVCGEKIRK